MKLFLSELYNLCKDKKQIQNILKNVYIYIYIYILIEYNKFIMVNFKSTS